jgi:hypothetical protein
MKCVSITQTSEVYAKANTKMEQSIARRPIINRSKHFIKAERQRLQVAKQILLYTGKHIGTNILHEAFSFIYQTFLCDNNVIMPVISKKCIFGTGMIPWRFPETFGYYYANSKIDTLKIPVTHQKTDRHEFGLWYYIAIGCSDIFLSVLNPLVVRNKIHALHFLGFKIQQSITDICEASYNIKQQLFSITNQFDKLIFNIAQKMGYDSVILTHQPQGNGKSTYPEILDLRVQVPDTYYRHIHKAAHFLTNVNGSRCELDCWAECCLSCKNSILSRNACLLQKSNKNNIRKCYDTC